MAARLEARGRRRCAWRRVLPRKFSESSIKYVLPKDLALNDLMLIANLQ